MQCMPCLERLDVDDDLVLVLVFHATHSHPTAAHIAELTWIIMIIIIIVIIIIILFAQ